MTDAPKPPETLSDERVEFESGSRAMVRALTLTGSGERRSAVMLTSFVPDDFFDTVADGGYTATAMLGSSEARELAKLLLAAADTAESAAPPFFGETGETGETGEA